jgi:general L-amino acid transport system substrate-binding protein
LRLPLPKSLLALLLAVVPAHASTRTLTRIRQTHILRCGINQETPEYSSTDDHGPRQAFDADICRAVAIAILGPYARTILTPYPDDVAALAALGAGKVDMLPTLTLDLTHSAHTAITFSSPLLYDGVGFLVPVTADQAANLTHAAQLAGKKICFLGATQVEPSLRAWFSQQHFDFVAFPFNEEGEMEAAFVTGNCTALAGDLTRLASTRIGFGPLASHYTLLSEQVSNGPVVIAQDPLAAASRSDDPAFAAVVEWTIEVLLNAEQSTLTQQSPMSSSPHPLLPYRSEAEGSSSSSEDPTIEILTGQTHEIGSRLGLNNAWATQVIAAVGNYGEIYDRDLGGQSPLKLPRAQNRLYTHEGLMYPLPLK